MPVSHGGERVTTSYPARQVYDSILFPVIGAVRITESANAFIARSLTYPVIGAHTCFPDEALAYYGYHY